MNFNHDTGLIDTILTLDTTTSPPIGGLVQSLTVLGSGSLVLPQGLDAQRPGSPVGGMLRFNTTSNTLEYHNGTTWATVGSGSGSGTVTSVTVAGGTGLSSSGSPITTSGTITLTLGVELQGLSALAANGSVHRTAAGTYASRTLTGTASNISVTNGDGVAGNPTVDLINAGTPVTGSFVKITTDAKGRVTATAAVATADITTLVDATYVNVTGDTMSSAANLTFTGGGEVLGLPAAPSGATAAVSKAYVDSISQGLDPKASVRAGTVVAGTLATSFANGQVIDGITLATGDRILIKNQAAPAENGIYTVNATGAPTRATDMDAWTEVPGAHLFVEQGTTLADTGWVCTADQGGTIGTTAITFVQFSGIGTYQAGTGLTLTGNTFSITAPVTPALGGTGTTSAPTAGQILIGTSGGVYTPAALTQGTGITLTSASGSVTVANAGVLSIAGTANQIVASAATGAVTLSLPASVTVTNLTISGLNSNAFVYSGTADLITSTAAPTNGQLLIGSTGAAPVAAALTQGTGITVTNGAGSITIANAGVTSVIAGTGISVSSATGAVTIGNTGVTSVGLSLPAIFSVSGSPVTTTGTLTATLATQAANTFFAGPAATTGAPTFRAITYADLTAGALQLYRENIGTVVAPVASGANSIALGSGAQATAAESFAFGGGAVARTYGMEALASGSFATAGDAQCGIYIMRNLTTTATITELFLNGVTATQRIVIANNSVYTFSILISARRTDATGGGAGYRVDGAIRKDTTAGSTTMIGTPSKSILGETTAAWDVTVDADTTNGSLRVRVTGEAAKTIRWVAVVTTSEVTN